MLGVETEEYILEPFVTVFIRIQEQNVNISLVFTEFRLVPDTRRTIHFLILLVSVTMDGKEICASINQSTSVEVAENGKTAIASVSDTILGQNVSTLRDVSKGG